MRRAAPLLLFVVLLGTLPALANPELDAAFGQSTIVITASRDACYRFDVYLAIENAQWRRGLMYVKALDPWRGMLFVYPNEGQRSMWMKNTMLPLDMLFIRANGRISSIATNTEPQSLRSIASVEDVQYVLELNAGVTQRLAIKPNDSILWAGDVSQVRAN
ncbi:MAG: DUF192 domain-containing protein [Woeseia sp.]